MHEPLIDTATFERAQAPTGAGQTTRSRSRGHLRTDWYPCLDPRASCRNAEVTACRARMGQSGLLASEAAHSSFILAEVPS